MRATVSTAGIKKPSPMKSIPERKMLRKNDSLIRVGLCCL